MSRLSTRALGAALLITAASALPAGAQTSPAPAATVNADLFRRMVAVNSALRSYTASTHVDIALKTFPYLSPSLDGNYYYKAPDKSAVVFNTVPALANQFKKVYPRLDPPSRWMAIYDVSQLGDESGTTTFRLVPKKNGRVEHLDVKVDDANATVTSYTWTYKDGGSITFDQTYSNVSGNYLIKSQTGRVDLPSYKADVKTAFANYKVNVPVSDQVFAQ